MTEPVIASKAPFATQVEAGKTYYWCSCGRSRTQPFCDGSHKGTDLSPIAWQAPETGTVYFCGCKRTRNPPLCDGSHKQLGS